MCSWSHDNKRLASCSVDWSVKIWDVITGKEIADLMGHDKPVKACSFSPDGIYLVSCSQDCTAKVWNIAKEDWVTDYKGHNGQITSCCFSPDGNNVASSSENIIQIWIALTGQYLHSCESKTASLVLHCTYSPNGDLIAAGLSDFSIQIWNATSCDTLAVFKGHSGWVYVVDFDCDGKRLLSGSDDGTTMIWDVESGQNQELVGLKRDFAATYSESDDIVVVAPDLANRIRIICGHSGDSKFNRSKSQMTPSEECRIRCCTISSTNEIAYGTDKGHVKVISLEGVILHNFPQGHTCSVRWCCYTQDGKVLVTCSDDKTIKIWKELGEPVVCIGHTDSVRRCKLFDNDTRILSSSHDGTIKVWDARSGKLHFSCDGHKEWVLSCDVSPDGSLLVSTSVDRTAKIWSAENGTRLYTIRGHKDCIRSCRFSADSQLLATGDDQGEIQIWKTKNGKFVSKCARHHCWVTDIQWSPDSKRLVSVSENIKWWQVDGLVCKHYQSKVVSQNTYKC
ncbi:apoptotic protease-activating factor 1-like [Ptychodera flava]|uniref:apoptotic protease-activating factor 1-like n=1 Tax=Ptychodera flava TaxID=63121 RepID=UPI00396A25B7